MKSTNFDVLKEKAKSLPPVPGVYLYRDSHGDIIYVGKAKNLKNRVGSYFNITLEPESKTFALVQNIASLEYIEVNSEFDALILEAELIRLHHPKYNIDLKDDKSYLYIVIRNEEFVVNGKKLSVPKILTARRTTIKKKDRVFGPYPDGRAPKYIITALRKVIPFRDCSPNKFATYQKLGSPCLYGHLGLCSAPCSKYNAENIAEYKKYIKHVSQILSGKSVTYINNLQAQMIKYAKLGEYEQAGFYRDSWQKFEYLRQNFRPASAYIDNPYLLSDLAKKALEELQVSLPHIKSLPKRIECYDIANISGKEAVGAMVVALEGKIDKREYRKFQIRLKAEPDDFGMLREVLERRLLHELDSTKQAWGMPDLLVVDGGKGQVSTALAVLEKLQLEIPLVGLAKKLETIVYKDNVADGFVEMRLPKDNKGLNLLIRLRDEAHRFGQKYHHELRLRKISK